ncbi:MAG: hypothetical protein QOE05_3322 [Actinomycetota bacterium]|nr:hypothetical protein [Actinomycetota bacterium]
MPDDPGARHVTPEPKPRPGDDEKPVLPDVSTDELDVGWGDEPSERDDEWYRRERPPHHG